MVVSFLLINIFNLLKNFVIRLKNPFFLLLFIFIQHAFFKLWKVEIIYGENFNTKMQNTGLYYSNYYLRNKYMNNRSFEILFWSFYYNLKGEEY